MKKEILSEIPKLEQLLEMLAINGDAIEHEMWLAILIESLRWANGEDAPAPLRQIADTDLLDSVGVAISAGEYLELLVGAPND